MLQQGLVHRTMGVFCALLLLITVSSAAKTTRHSPSKSGTSMHASSTTHKASKTVRSTSKRGKRNSRSASAKGGKKSSAKKVVRGQQGIDSERASEIQAALIREKYLDGEPTGVFDQRTKDALIKFQAANGWQTKVLPDSRALIKLGLGPSTSGLLNPESAAMGQPHQLGEEKEIPGGSMTIPRK